MPSVDALRRRSPCWSSQWRTCRTLAWRSGALQRAPATGNVRRARADSGNREVPPPPPAPEPRPKRPRTSSDASLFTPPGEAVVAPSSTLGRVVPDATKVSLLAAALKAASKALEAEKADAAQREITLSSSLKQLRREKADVEAQLRRFKRVPVQCTMGGAILRPTLTRSPTAQRHTSANYISALCSCAEGYAKGA
eukprot:3530411-Prymnesium_polylepis.1